MDADTLNLNDDDYLSVEDMMIEHQNEDDQDDEGDSITSPAKIRARARGNKRRHSIAWKNFSIVGDRLPDGTHNVKCNHCQQPYNLDLNRNGTNTMLRHSRRCSKTPGCTPGSNRKLDMVVFRDMMALAIVEHNLPYQFVEYRRVRDALAYANSSIVFWSRNTAVSDVLKIYEKEKANLRKVLSEASGKISFTTDL